MGGRSCDLTLPLTLPGLVWDGVCRFSLVIGSGGVLCVLDREERPLPLPPQACRPPGPRINLSHASALPHGVPTSCLSAHVCPFGACSKFGRVLPALPLSILLTASTSLLTLPPTIATILSSSDHSLLLLSDILSSTFFSDVVGNMSNASTTVSMMLLINYVNIQNNGDIPVTSLESQVMQLLDLLISHDELNDINVYFSLFNHQSGCSLTNLLSSRQHVSYSYLQIQYLLLSDPGL